MCNWQALCFVAYYICDFGYKYRKMSDLPVDSLLFLLISDKPYAMDERFWFICAKGTRRVIRHHSPVNCVL